MPGAEQPTRRTVLAAVGAGVTTTGVAGGRDSTQETDRDHGNDSSRVSIRINNCYSATVWTRNPDAEIVNAGLYFRETGRYDFYQAQVEFPYVLVLPRFEWAREQDAVLTNVSVQDTDYNTIARASVPEDWNCEETGPGRRGAADDADG